MIDLAGHIEPEDMPLCPLCDDVILDWDGAVLVSCGGAKGIARTECVAELADDDGDDDA